MKLIIPMAGRGTRVRPHSHTVPKPLLPVAGTMIVERLVETFIRTMDRTIEEIVYILGPDFGSPIKEPLEQMSARHGAKCSFRVQETALGTAHAVYCAQQDLDGEVIIAFADTLFDSKETFNVDGADSVIWLKKVEDPLDLESLFMRRKNNWICGKASGVHLGFSHHWSLLFQRRSKVKRRASIYIR